MNIDKMVKRYRKWLDEKGVTSDEIDMEGLTDNAGTAYLAGYQAAKAKFKRKKRVMWAIYVGTGFYAVDYTRDNDALVDVYDDFNRATLFATESDADLKATVLRQLFGPNNAIETVEVEI